MNKHPNPVGPVPILEGAELERARADRRAATCGTCGRSWDDTEPTAWTPAPAGRCPFEYMHPDPWARVPELEHVAPCPACSQPRPDADGLASFVVGSVCPHCGHVEPDNDEHPDPWSRAPELEHTRPEPWPPLAPDDGRPVPTWTRRTWHHGRTATPVVWQFEPWGDDGPAYRLAWNGSQTVNAYEWHRGARWGTEVDAWQYMQRPTVAEVLDSCRDWMAEQLTQDGPR